MVIAKLIPQSYVLLTDLQIFSTKTSIFIKEQKKIRYIYILLSLPSSSAMISGMRLTFLEPLSCFIFIPFLSLPDNPDEMNKFELTSAYRPTGDQPEAIAQLTEGVLEGVPAQTLLGVTGSGKTFTIANVIANINKPTLILSHTRRWRHNSTASSRDSSRTTQWNITYPITTITSPKPTCPLRTPI